MKIKLLITSLLFAFAFPTQAATFYVNGATGNDDKDCATVTDACKTPWKAYEVAAAGDTILITKGTYTIPTGGHFWLKKAIAFKGGYDATFEPLLSRSKNAADTIITGNNALTYRLFVLTTGHSNWVVFDTLTLTGAANSGNHAGALLTHMDLNESPEDGAWLRLNNVIVRDNYMHSGKGAIQITRPGDKLEIISSRFENNQVNGSGGAIAVDSAAEVIVESSSFIGNKSVGDGAAIYAAAGSLTITNSTFSGNIASAASSNGALAFSGSSQAHLRYNTISENKAQNRGGVIFLSGSSGILQANLILNNKDGSNHESNLGIDTGATFTDGGYNYIGSVNDAGLTGGSTFSSKFTHQDKDNQPTSLVISASFEQVIKPVAYNGGPSGTLTNKLIANSPARDVIPNESIPFYGVGVSVDYPFISLKQARATVGLDDTRYKPGKSFYFDLAGSYDEFDIFTTDNIESLQFTAQVDENGWVKTDKVSQSAHGVIDVELRGDNSDQWVIGESSICSGLISTDGRGLPRSDKVKAEEKKNKCDVGAFEYNDYHRHDCYDEDGLRKENTLNDAEVCWEFNPFDGITPRDIMENMGAFQWYWSLLLIGLYGIRRKLKN